MTWAGPGRRRRGGASRCRAGSRRWRRQEGLAGDRVGGDVDEAGPDVEDRRADGVRIGDVDPSTTSDQPRLGPVMRTLGLSRRREQRSGIGVPDDEVGLVGPTTAHDGPLHSRSPWLIVTVLLTQRLRPWCIRSTAIRDGLVRVPALRTPWPR